MLGDRWSLLILRDMMLRGFRSFKEFLTSYEGIATNILSDRLKRLIAYGIITTQEDHADGRKLIYVLTPKGLDLAPVLTEMVLWAAKHEETGNQPLVRQMQKGKEQFLEVVRQRYLEKTRSSGESHGPPPHDAISHERVRQSSMHDFVTSLRSARAAGPPSPL